MGYVWKKENGVFVFTSIWKMGIVPFQLLTILRIYERKNGRNIDLKFI